MICTYEPSTDSVAICGDVPANRGTRPRARTSEWFSDPELTNKVIRVEIVYTRDYFGFAVSRTTTRMWVLSNEQYCPIVKVTEKKYTINMLDQITEGKKRRENIVNGVQMPTMQFMITTIQGVSQSVILLMGRDFMDRFSLHFKNFIQLLIDLFVLYYYL